MLTINLLPERMRPVEHTPYPRLISIIVGIVVVCVMIFMVLKTYLNTQKVLRATEQLKQEKAAKESELVASNFSDNIQFVAAQRVRIQTLLDRFNERFLWSPKLNTLYKHGAKEDDYLFPPEIYVRTLKMGGRALRIKTPESGSSPPTISVELCIFNAGDLSSSKILDNFKEKLRSLGKDKNNKVTDWPAPTAENALSGMWDFIDPASADTFVRLNKSSGKYDTVTGTLKFKQLK